MNNPSLDCQYCEEEIATQSIKCIGCGATNKMCMGCYTIIMVTNIVGMIEEMPDLARKAKKIEEKVEQNKIHLPDRNPQDWKDFIGKWGK